MNAFTENIGDPLPFPDLPVGALVSPPGTLRRCSRCLHFECPHCGDWCDVCLNGGDDDPSSADHHPVCSRDLACDFGGQERSPNVQAIQAEARRRFGSCGGMGGSLDDGRMWEARYDPQRWTCVELP